MNGELENGNESTVGSLLRASRLRREEDLVSVAEVLRVRLFYLEAIEEARYSVLPGNVYAIGFIRTYAEYLGLDSEEVIRRYKLESVGSADTSLLVFPSPIVENRIPGGAVLFIGVLITLITYGGWYLSSTQYGFLSGFVAPLPDRLLSTTGDAKPQKEERAIAEDRVTVFPTGTEIIETRDNPQEKEDSEKNAPSLLDTEVMEKAKGTSNRSSPPMAKEMPQSILLSKSTEKKVVTEALQAKISMASVVTPKEEFKRSEANRSSTDTSTSSAAEQLFVPKMLVETTPASEAKSIRAKLGASSISAPTQPKAKQSTKAEAPITPSPQVAGVGLPVQKELIILRAKDDSWILIRDGNTNQLLIRKLLRAGETYRVPNQKGLTLEAGNAGALEITVDGEAISAIGAFGAVLKNIALDAKQLREGKAVAQ
jgi:cytoskeleton protein RodZ